MIGKQEARAYSKDISTFCGRLLEETEDELSELIKKGSVKVGEVSKVLCQDLGRYCSKTSGNGKAVDDEDTSDRELFLKMGPPTLQNFLEMRFQCYSTTLVYSFVRGSLARKGS
ncbi:UNVERIFIED_CONTAM: hypothetical protein Sradi_3871500 [Sesamum radiatum]|uniref:DUF3456 domain-containing protein n=1 Tax=Sesamum radiatum TaxID=300843 RepID=A0AAW2Q2C6_SESRA